MLSEARKRVEEAGGPNQIQSPLLSSLLRLSQPFDLHSKIRAYSKFHRRRSSSFLHSSTSYSEPLLPSSSTCDLGWPRSRLLEEYNGCHLHTPCTVSWRLLTLSSLVFSVCMYQTLRPYLHPSVRPSYTYVCTHL